MLGKTFSLAEVAAAPWVERMIRMLPYFRNVDFFRLCRQSGLTRTEAWCRAIVERPSVVESTAGEVEMRRAARQLVGPRSLSAKTPSPAHRWEFAPATDPPAAHCQVGAYYKGGLTAIDGVVVEGYDRAAPAGVDARPPSDCVLRVVLHRLHGRLR